MYILYYPNTDENEIKGKIFRIIPNDYYYNIFIKKYNFIEYKNIECYGAYMIEENNQRKSYLNRIKFYVEKIKNDNIIYSEKDINECWLEM